MSTKEATIATTRLAGLSLLAAVALATCGGSASAPAATSAPVSDAPAVVDAIDACALLTAGEVAAAFGVPADQVQPMPGSTALPGSRTCFFRPPGVADGPQVNVALLASPDFSRPADPFPAPGLEGAAGAWWLDQLTGDLNLEATAPNGVRLTLAYQDTSADGPPTEGALAFLVPLATTALGRLP